MRASGRFPRSAWFVLVVALLLLLVSVIQIGYRFTLPTDGWQVYTTDVADSNWFYDVNLVGAPSALQRGDGVLAVDGRSVSGSATSAYIPAPSRWQVGQTVTMLIERDGDQLEVAVPVVGWTGKALWRHNAGQLDSFIGLIGSLLFLAVSWFTFLRRAEVSSARALLLLATTMGAATISSVLPDGLSVQFNQTAFIFTSFFSYVIFGTVFAPSLLAFALLFPRPKRVIKRRPWLVLLPYGYGLLLFLFLLLGGPGEVGWVSTLVLIVLTIASFLHAARTQHDAVSRAQLRWAISSFLAGMALFALNFPLGFGWITTQFWVDLLGALASLGFGVIGTGLAVAVLRYRLFDIDVIIRRTLVYGLVSLLLALVYFGMVVLLQSIFAATTAARSPLIIVLSTLLIAALFAPLRARVQALVDRRFYRQKYDAQQVLAAFAQRARDEISLEALTAETVRVVQETMQPELVSLWLKPTLDRRAVSPAYDRGLFDEPWDRQQR